MTFITSLVVVLPAYAWQNGNAARGLGRVTAQQWILDRADSLAGRAGAGWLDESAASASISWPDTRFRDFRFHYYDRSGKRQGGTAPRRIAAVYEKVVDALVANDMAKASSAFGVLAHYYTDICEPFHTDNAPIEWRNGLHDRYEQRVMRLINNGGDEAIRRAAAPGAVSDITTSITQFSIDTASAAHADYWDLPRGRRPARLRHGVFRDNWDDHAARRPGRRAPRGARQEGPRQAPGRRHADSHADADAHTFAYTHA